ncbi:hypothetical protein RRF57_007658 [Xylaria bambusicola]|uniref:Uncharacterized protein n=1 Tax=Xylaria bambusicola TaxID=326684 RepID=A0AAN7UQU4_9PEZI
MGVKIHIRDKRPLVGAVTNQVAEIFESNFALGSCFQRLISARTELFNRSRQTDAEIVSRKPQHFAY